MGVRLLLRSLVPIWILFLLLSFSESSSFLLLFPNIDNSWAVQRQPLRSFHKKTTRQGSTVLTTSKNVPLVPQVSIPSSSHSLFSHPTESSQIPSSSIMSLRQRLLQGYKSYGPVCMSDSPILIELLAMAGYGHMILDHEHSPTDLRSGQHLLLAMDAAAAATRDPGNEFVRTEPIVRLPNHDDASYMKKVLDSMRLPGGVLVPMVENADMARQVVQSTRYPRQIHHIEQASGKDIQTTGSSIRQDNGDVGGGIRGCAVPFIRASHYGRNRDYMMKQCQEDL